MESFNNVKQWLSEIDQYANDSVCKLLVGNKCDLADTRAVKTSVAQAYADEIGIPFLETSAKESINVEEAFLAMSAEIKKMYGKTVSDFSRRGYPDTEFPRLLYKQSWESGRPGEEALQSSSDERPANSSSTAAAEE
ncbi:hypothetical protein BS78_05G179800 [Paspalum vaginatum]|nr:hypothetical protein BS78_05G179800 [Paspalum vaginatum]